MPLVCVPDHDSVTTQQLTSSQNEDPSQRAILSLEVYTVQHPRGVRLDPDELDLSLF